jgi:hypothetical protein
MRLFRMIAALAVLSFLPGCVTVGYDFLNQRATLTVDPGHKK